MKKFLLLLLLLGFAPLFALDIVLPESPHKYEKMAAEELAEALKKGNFPAVRIVAEKEAAAPALYLGKSFYPGSLPENKESWGIVTVKNGNMFVAGTSPIGTLYGVYSLLRHCGVYFLTYEATVIPDFSTWKNLPPVNEVKTPSFAGRQTFSRYPNFFRDTRAKEADSKFWYYYLRNGFNGVVPAFVPKALYLGDEMRWTTKVHFVHNYYEFLPPEKYFASHPEYFSMNRSGQRSANAHRRGTQLCLSNPEVAKIVADKLKEFIRQDRAELPEEQWPLIYNITPNDAANEICFCPSCKAIVAQEGCETGLLVRFTNEIARQVREEFPGIRLLTRAAMGSEILPKTAPLPGVTAYYADDFTNTSCFVPLTEERKKNILRWAEYFPGMMLWDYWNMGLGAYFTPPRPEVVIDAVISDVKWMHRNGIVSIFAEAERDFLIPQNFLDLEFFLLGQLMLDANQDAEKLIDIFINGYYGKAAEPVKEYLSALRAGVKSHSKVQLCCAALRWDFLTADFMLKNYSLLQRALQLAADDPEALLRVKAECLPLFWSIVYYRRDTETLFVQNGITMEQVLDQLKQYSGEVLANFGMSKKYLESNQKKLAAKLMQLEANLAVPGKFAGIAGCRVFAWPHQKRVAHSRAIPVEDKEALSGRAVRSNFHKSRKFSDIRTRSFTFYDFETKHSIALNVDPADEEYHWYTIKNVRVSKNSIFTAHLWMTQIDLSQAWEFPHAGKPEVNDYDLHFRAKFTGPSYFPGSTQEDAVWVDSVVLVPKMKRD